MYASPSAICWPKLRSARRVRSCEIWLYNIKKWNSHSHRFSRTLPSLHWPWILWSARVFDSRQSLLRWVWGFFRDRDRSSRDLRVLFSSITRITECTFIDEFRDSRSSVSDSLACNESLLPVKFVVSQVDNSEVTWHSLLIACSSPNWVRNLFRSASSRWFCLVEYSSDLRRVSHKERPVDGGYLNIIQNGEENKQLILLSHGNIGKLNSHLSDVSSLSLAQETRRAGLAFLWNCCLLRDR